MNASPAATFAYRRSPDQDAAQPVRHRVVIVGAGLVGLTLAIDLRRQGVDAVVLERRAGISEGSRSICQAKRTLEIWDRLGAGRAIRDRGVTWNVGRVFRGARQLYEFDLLPESGHAMPAFVNLQQYLVEELLLATLVAQGGEVRWQHACTSLANGADGVALTVATPEGDYALQCDWLVACDGARSVVRRELGLNPTGAVFEDKFLISDVRMRAQFPAERWFWFDPPFHAGQTALLHRQADDVWRVDMQLGWDADVELEKRPERVRERVRRMLGPDVEFDLVWVSVYVFQCRTLDRYVHGRVIFAGDSAHQVSPFGARGGNGGVQDADNLAWKLARVLDGRAGPGLLDSYDAERLYAARENILHSTRATDFMTPKTRLSRVVRDAALDLAVEDPVVRRLVNSGRLSVPARLERSPLSTPDADAFAGGVAPGCPALDAPVAIDGRPAWFLNAIGDRYTLLVAGAAAARAAIAGAVAAAPALANEARAAGAPREPMLLAGEQVDVVTVDPADVHDVEGTLARRYDLAPGTVYLFRPDQHVAARWRSFDRARVERALRAALGYAA